MTPETPPETDLTLPEVASDHVTIYPTGDDYRITLPWIIKDYEEKGALSPQQKQTISATFGLSPALVDELSVYVGNSLDSGSSIVFYPLTKSRATERAQPLVRKALRKLKAGASEDAVRHMLKDTTGVFANCPDDAHLAASIFSEDMDLQSTLEKLLRRPDAIAVLTPDDKRAIKDVRRMKVVESCCHIWADAGRPLTVTTESTLDKHQRGGPLITFIQMVVAMTTSPQNRISGETLDKDIERIRKHRAQPDFMTQEPEFGQSGS